MLTKKTPVIFSLFAAVIALMLLIGGLGTTTVPQPDAGGFEWGLTTPSPSSPSRPQHAPLA